MPTTPSQAPARRRPTSAEQRLARERLRQVAIKGDAMRDDTRRPIDRERCARVKARAALRSVATRRPLGEPRARSRRRRLPPRRRCWRTNAWTRTPPRSSSSCRSRISPRHRCQGPSMCTSSTANAPFSSFSRGTGGSPLTTGGTADQLAYVGRDPGRNDQKPPRLSPLNPGARARVVGGDARRSASTRRHGLPRWSPTGPASCGRRSALVLSVRPHRRGVWQPEVPGSPGSFPRPSAIALVERLESVMQPSPPRQCDQAQAQAAGLVAVLLRSSARARVFRCGLLTERELMDEPGPVD